VGWLFVGSAWIFRVARCVDRGVPLGPQPRGGGAFIEPLVVGLGGKGVGGSVSVWFQLMGCGDGGGVFADCL